MKHPRRNEAYLDFKKEIRGMVFTNNTNNNEEAGIIVIEI